MRCLGLLLLLFAVLVHLHGVNALDTSSGPHSSGPSEDRWKHASDWIRKRLIRSAEIPDTETISTDEKGEVSSNAEPDLAGEPPKHVRCHITIKVKDGKPTVDGPSTPQTVTDETKSDQDAKSQEMPQQDSGRTSADDEGEDNNDGTKPENHDGKEDNDPTEEEKEGDAVEQDPSDNGKPSQHKHDAHSWSISFGRSEDDKDFVQSEIPFQDHQIYMNELTHPVYSCEMSSLCRLKPPNRNESPVVPLQHDNFHYYIGPNDKHHDTGGENVPNHDVLYYYVADNHHHHKYYYFDDNDFDDDGADYINDHKHYDKRADVEVDDILRDVIDNVIDDNPEGDNYQLSTKTTSTESSSPTTQSTSEIESTAGSPKSSKFVLSSGNLATVDAPHNRKHVHYYTLHDNKNVNNHYNNDKCFALALDVDDNDDVPEDNVYTGQHHDVLVDDIPNNFNNNNNNNNLVDDAQLDCFQIRPDNNDRHGDVIDDN
ncbi:hypothetical protein QR680_014262 [Steinernema hermaphroditum]|uniref:Uncharacterized protein n=1 Tax=Steinernema hermaphroditum TaxID=289476 RepID=A0AA39M3X9_9BILA|nr:hypothetical protein QR680_014262 [Steinernema hermaphroditum]